ncbi:MAG: hypothetical protein ACRDWE_01755 [Acidimicrobiales bacterium]
MPEPGDAGTAAGAGGRARARGTFRFATALLAVSSAAVVAGALLSTIAAHGDSVPSKSTSAVVDGRFARPDVVGGLEIEPDPTVLGSTPLGLRLAQAETDARLTTGLATPLVVGFGLVTITDAAMPAGTPPLVATPAWIAISPAPRAFSCPAMTVPPVTTSSPASHYARISVGVYFGTVADGGAGAVVYRSAGTLPCEGGQAAAAVTRAVADVPVAWQVTGPAGATTLRYDAPVCATLDSVSTSGNVRTPVVTVTVTVQVPFDRAGCAAVATFTTTAAFVQTPAPAGAPVPSLPSDLTLAHSALPTGLSPALFGPLGAAR